MDLYTVYVCICSTARVHRTCFQGPFADVTELSRTKLVHQTDGLFATVHPTFLINDPVLDPTSSVLREGPKNDHKENATRWGYGMLVRMADAVPYPVRTSGSTPASLCSSCMDEPGSFPVLPRASVSVSLQTTLVGIGNLFGLQIFLHQSQTHHSFGLPANPLHVEATGGKETCAKAPKQQWEGGDTSGWE